MGHLFLGQGSAEQVAEARKTVKEAIDCAGERVAFRKLFHAPKENTL